MRSMIYLMIFIIALPLTFFLGGCEDEAVNQPSYKPKIWAGDSSKAGLYRKQSGEYLSSKSPEFDDYLAVSTQTMSCIIKTYLINCKSYKDKNPNPECVSE